MKKELEKLAELIVDAIRSYRCPGYRGRAQGKTLDIATHIADHLLANKEQFIAKAKAEAVREFAEALVDTADIIQVDSFHYEYRISGDGIDDLVKKRSEEAYKALEERKEK